MGVLGELRSGTRGPARRPHPRSGREPRRSLYPEGEHTGATESIFCASVVRSPRGDALSAGNETGDGRFHEHSPRAFAGPVCDPPVAHARQTFAAKFLQIIRGVAGAVPAWALFTECAHASGDIGGSEAVGELCGKLGDEVDQAAW